MGHICLTLVRIVVCLVDQSTFQPCGYENSIDFKSYYSLRSTEKRIDVLRHEFSEALYHWSLSVRDGTLPSLYLEILQCIDEELNAVSFGHFESQQLGYIKKAVENEDIKGLELISKNVLNVVPGEMPIRHIFEVKYDELVEQYLKGDYVGVQISLVELFKEYGHFDQEARGKIFGFMALCKSHLGLPGPALDLYNASRLEFISIGDLELLIPSDMNLAAAYFELGMKEKSIEFLSMAVNGAPLVESPMYRVRIYSEAAAIMARYGCLDDALVLQRTALKEAQLIEDPLLESHFQIQCLIWDGAILALSGKFDLAKKSFEDAQQLLINSDGPMSNRLRAHLILELDLVEFFPEVAIQNLKESLDYFTSIDMQQIVFRAEIHLKIARRYLELGDIDQAEKHFECAIESIEAQRESLNLNHLRVFYYDHLKTFFEEIIQVQLEKRNDPLRGLFYLERSRARTLSDFLAASPHHRQHPEFDHLVETLPTIEGTKFLVYRAAEDQLSIWSLGEGKTGFIQKEMTSLDEYFKAYEKKIAMVQDPDEASEALFEILLTDEQGRSLIKDVQRLVIVPDPQWAGFSFAGLRDSARGKFLVQLTTISLAPSLTSWFSGMIKPGSSLNASVFIAPHNDAEQYLELAPLEPRVSIPDDVYPRVDRFVGPEATETAFRQALASSDVLYFGGHSLVPSDREEGAHLVLAGNDLEQGALYLSELYDLENTRTRLAILASCRTAKGRVSPTEGVLSLARGFIVAGVPEVISSLWDVPDKQTNALFDQFHQAYKESKDAALALRRAQEHAITKGLPVADWASFQVIGVRILGE